MAGSTPLAPSSVPVSGLKDRILGKNQSQTSPSSNRLVSFKNKMSSNKTAEVNPISRKSSVFTIENLLAPSIKSSSPVSSTILHRTSPVDSTTSPAAFNPSEMVQQQLQYHHQNLFHHHHQQFMPLGLTDPSTYGYTYLG